MHESFLRIMKKAFGPEKKPALPAQQSGFLPVHIRLYSDCRKSIAGNLFSRNIGFRNQYDKRINLKLQFPLLHIIPAGEDFYF